MNEDNPYLDQTSFTPRPTGTEAAYRYQTIASLTRDQRLWDAARAAGHDTNRLENAHVSPTNHSIVLSARIEMIAPLIEGSRPSDSSLPFASAGQTRDMVTSEEISDVTG